MVLNGLIKSRGDELQPYIASLIGGFLQAMEGITNDATMNGTLHALKNLALHHPLPVFDNLLTAPLPHSPQVIKAFQVLAKDRTLVMPLINHLTDIINNKVPYDEKFDQKTKKVISRTPEYVSMAATAALGEIMQTDELEEIINSNYPQVCYAIHILHLKYCQAAILTFTAAFVGNQLFAHLFVQILVSLLLRLGTANGNLSKTMEAPASNPKAKPAAVAPSQYVICWLLAVSSSFLYIVVICMQTSSCSLPSVFRLRQGYYCHGCFGRLKQLGTPGTT